MKVTPVEAMVRTCFEKFVAKSYSADSRFMGPRWIPSSAALQENTHRFQRHVSRGLCLHCPTDSLHSLLQQADVNSMRP